LANISKHGCCQWSPYGATTVREKRA
jgi:hypothetical protein